MSGEGKKKSEADAKAKAEAGATEDKKKSEAKSKKGTRPFAVELKCSTPLANNPTVLMADSTEQAKERFMARNGISDSDHEFIITDDKKSVEEVRKKKDEPASDDQG